MKFSEVLDAYLDHRMTGPDERDGYTDKAWYRREKELAEQLDSFFKKGSYLQ